MREWLLRYDTKEKREPIIQLTETRALSAASANDLWHKQEALFKGYCS